MNYMRNFHLPYMTFINLSSFQGLIEERLAQFYGTELGTYAQSGVAM